MTAGNNEDTMLLAIAGHELRTPLNGVVGFADLLATTNLTEEQIYYVSMIQDSASSLLVIIEDLLDYSKSEKNTVRSLNEALNIGNVVEDVISLVMATPDARGIKIKSWIDPFMPTVVGGNPAHLRQILLNLVANAAAFTPHGTVEVTVTPGAHADRIRFEISDTGIGIAADDLPMLFRPFSQLSQSCRRAGGTGLGLAICKRLVEGMPNGMIGVSSTPGHESVFWFEADLHDISLCNPSGSSEAALRIRGWPTYDDTQRTNPDRWAMLTTTNHLTADSEIIEQRVETLLHGSVCQRPADVAWSC